jgi:hypothetical protein
MIPRPSETAEASLNFDPVAIPLAGILCGLIWLIAVKRLDSRWGTWRFLERIIAGFPPLFTVIVSPLLTYFCICGALSSITATLLSWGSGGKPASAGIFLGTMKLLEWLCSFIGPFVFSVFLLRLRLPLQCCLVLALSHALVAGYRTAKYIVTRSDDGLIVRIESGPRILDRFDLVDGLVPLAAFAAVVLWHRRRRQHISMDITNPSILFAALVLCAAVPPGCSRRPQVTVSNLSSATLTNVVISGSGFSQALGTLAPAGKASASVALSGDSSLRVEFDAGGKHFTATPDCYFESSPNYQVSAIVAPDFTVKADVGMKKY